MPEFASIAAYVVIDTFVLLMWHQILFVKICRETVHYPQLEVLIRRYLFQCRPGPMWSEVDRRIFQSRCISFTQDAFNPDQA